MEFAASLLLELDSAPTVNLLVVDLLPEGIAPPFPKVDHKAFENLVSYGLGGQS